MTIMKAISNTTHNDLIKSIQIASELLHAETTKQKEAIRRLLVLKKKLQKAKTIITN